MCIVISIHTPAKGVTSNRKAGRLLCDISIHTPAKGVTSIEMLLSCGSHISIHTPAKGVTLKKDIRDELMFHFNPHSREGSDQIAKRVAHVQHNFNPHSREGSDDPSFTFKISLMISIHTPAKGVTPELTQDDIYNNGFQSTLPRRE